MSGSASYSGLRKVRKNILICPCAGKSDVTKLDVIWHYDNMKKKTRHRCFVGKLVYI